MYKLLLFSIMARSVDLATVRKQSIHLPILIPFTNDGPRKGIACKAASEIALNSFRKLPNVLNRKYWVEPVFLDEQGSKGHAIDELVRFTFNDKFKLAPIVVGPYFTPGCKAIASSLHHLNMVQIAMSCGSPSMTNKRSKFPNFYRIRSPGDVGVFPTLKFIKEIGHWDQIAVITTISNSYNYAIAKKMLRAATNINVTVAHFDFVNELDQMSIDRLKQSKLRVVALEIAQSSWILKFLCLTFKNGLTGPRYAFFLFLTGFSHPDGIPSNTTYGCTKEEILEQYKISHFVSAQQEPISNTSNSSSGLSVAEFESIYQQHLNGSVPADFEKRFQCYDVVSKALHSPNDAEEKLNNNFNKTLKNFIENSDFVMKIVNESVANGSIKSLRTGEELVYSSRLELDSDPQVIAHWDQDKGNLVVEYVCKMVDTNGADPDDIGKYQLFETNGVDWLTKDGKAPKEMATIEMVTIHVRFAISITIISLAIVFSIVLFLIIFYQWKAAETSTISNRCSMMATILPSILLFNLSSVAFALPWPSLWLCYIQPMLLVLAFSLANLFLLLESKPNGKFSKRFLIVFVLVIPLMLPLLWFVIDKIDLEETNLDQDFYDNGKDIEFHFKSFYCKSANFGSTNWAFLIIGYLLLVWLYMLNNFHWKIKSIKNSTAIIKSKEMIENNQQIHCKRQNMLQRCRVFVVNEISLAIATVLVVSSLEGIESQLTTISTTCLLFSVITSACFFIVAIKTKS